MATGGSQWVGSDGLTHYQRNKDAYVQRAKEIRLRNREYLRHIRQERGCADCGIKDWRVLDFDHLPGTVKSFGLGTTRAAALSIARLDLEIAKCEVVCSNCHRIRTHERRGDVAQW